MKLSMSFNVKPVVGIGGNAETNISPPEKIKNQNSSPKITSCRLKDPNPNLC